jgi:hypothetical protein
MEPPTQHRLMPENYVPITEHTRRGVGRETRKTITIGRCAELLRSARALGRDDTESRMNSTLTHGQALEILEKVVVGRPVDEPARCYTAKNVLRECGRPVGEVGALWT